MTRRALLVILDGFGLRDAKDGNAIAAANAPTLKRLLAGAPHTALDTSGEAVGLPPGQMGNSEVGHMNIGAGRVIYQMLTRIDKAIREGPFFGNPVLLAAIRHAKINGTRLHLMGLLSDGGVHSSQEHLHALVRFAKREGLAGDRVAIHAFTDGRDTSPTGGAGYVAALEAHLAAMGTGVIATVGGRYYAMDRDKRWERTKKAYDAIARGEGTSAPEGAGAYLKASYAGGVTDEFVVPGVVHANLRVAEGDAIVYFNFRPDRARQLTRALAEPGFSEFQVESRPRTHFASMTRYDETFTWAPFAFADERPTGTLGEVVAKAGLRQLRVAETEKYAHVTYFLNGGEEKVFPGEERVLVQSPKHVPTYDQAPEMSAQGVRDAIVSALVSDRFHLIVANFANCDMVGHTGDMAATVRAVETVDRCMSEILAAAQGRFEVFVTADHGNAEEMTNADGSPQTAHTTLPVPFCYVGSRTNAKLARGILADVAPTVLDAMGLPKPNEMTGRSLFD